MMAMPINKALVPQRSMFPIRSISCLLQNPRQSTAADPLVESKVTFAVPLDSETVLKTAKTPGQIIRIPARGGSVFTYCTDTLTGAGTGGSAAQSATVSGQAPAPTVCLMPLCAGGSSLLLEESRLRVPGRFRFDDRCRAHAAGGQKAETQRAPLPRNTTSSVASRMMKSNIRLWFLM